MLDRLAEPAATVRCQGLAPVSASQEPGLDFHLRTAVRAGAPAYPAGQHVSGAERTGQLPRCWGRIGVAGGGDCAELTNSAECRADRFRNAGGEVIAGASLSRLEGLDRHNLRSSRRSTVLASATGPPDAGNGEHCDCQGAARQRCRSARLRSPPGGGHTGSRSHGRVGCQCPSEIRCRGEAIRG